jgi:fumarate hydratase subunit alpha
MRIIKEETITNAVRELVMEANYNLCDDVLLALKKAETQENSPIGKEVLNKLVENARIAAEERIPICQDTGMTVIFLKLGNLVQVEGNIYEAINKGVRKGYQEGFLRKSVVRSPLNRVNTGDNTPAIIHTEIAQGDKIQIIVAPKGGGSENMSQLRMLKPADGIPGIKKVILETVETAGANACPPVIVGVGLGGNFEKAAILAKKALLRPLDDYHPDPEIASLEKELLEEINNLGIGSQGFGGNITALAVKIETYPCHIASLPVAVNLNCHAARHKEITI